MSEYEKLHVTISFFFEIKESKMFGGPGSVGYSEYRAEGNGLMLTDIVDFESAAQHLKERHARLFGVPDDCVKLITKEEYDLETDDEKEIHGHYSRPAVDYADQDTLMPAT